MRDIDQQKFLIIIYCLGIAVPIGSLLFLIGTLFNGLKGPSVIALVCSTAFTFWLMLNHNPLFKEMIEKFKDKN